MKTVLATRTMVSQPCDTETWDEDANPDKQGGFADFDDSIPEPETAEPETAEPETAEPETAEPETAEPETAEPETAEFETDFPDVAECITSSRVESEDRIVKFSTSGEDSGEAVEEDYGEDVEEDKENNINETDVVEDSGEDAPTFANASTSSGSDGDDDKDDRDKNIEFAYADIQSTKCEGYRTIKELYQKQETYGREEILKGYTSPASTDISCYTIPRYPDNHNPRLPLALQKKHVELNPSNIMEDLSCAMQSNSKDYSQCKDLYCAEDCRYSDELQRALRSPYGIHHVYAGVERDLTVNAVVIFPDNLALQELDEMSPRKFLTYVLRDLTLEERKSLMADESQRRKTFLVNWPHENDLPGVWVARAGLYCINDYDDYDRVQCAFCEFSIHKWGPGNKPMTEHARWFDFCPFVKGLECGNREYKNDVLSPEEPKNISYFGTPEMKKNRDGSVSIDIRRFGISTNKADTIQYAPEPTRLETFARWPASSALTPQQLCEAGNYFTGIDDLVRCFYCSGGLRDWKPNDKPWVEHARWFPECPFLLQQKGEDYVNEVHTRTSADKKCARMLTFPSGAGNERKSLSDDMDDKYRKRAHRKRKRPLYWTPEGNFKKKSGFQPADDPEDDEDYNVAGPQEPTAEAELRRQAAEQRMEEALAQQWERDGASQDQKAEDVLPERRGSVGRYPQGACVVCYIGTQQYVAATRIGLPCGHMIFCDRCDREEQVRAAAPEYKVKCPTCGGLLTGTHRFFLA